MGSDNWGSSVAMIDDIHLHGLNVSVTFKHKAITILHVQIIKL